MRVLLTAVLVVLVVGCSKKKDEVVDAGPPPTPAAPALKPLPTATSTLSVFEPRDGKCEWRHEDPVAKTSQRIATFPGTCVGARVSWSADASRAVVWFDPQWVQLAGYYSQTSTAPGYEDEHVDESAQPTWFLVDVRSGKVEPVVPPSFPKHELRELGLDTKGDVLALLEETLAEDAKTVSAGEETFDVSTISEGVPVLVHAYKRVGDGWKRAESKLSSTGWDYGMGVRELDANGTLGPKSDALLESHAQGDVPEGDEAKKLKKHAPKKAKTDDDGHFIFLGAGGSRVYVWEVTGEFAHTTGLIVANDEQLPELGFTDGDLVAIRSSEKYLLVSKSPTGTHARLYSLPDAKLLFKSDTARAVTFWPTTAKPEAHE